MIALELNPGYSYPYNNLGFVCYMEGDFDMALKYINKSIELDMSNSYAFKNRAIVLAKTGKIEGARKDLLTALELGYTEDYGNEVNDLLTSLSQK